MVESCNKMVPLSRGHVNFRGVHSSFFVASVVYISELLMRNLKHEGFPCVKVHVFFGSMLEVCNL